MVLGEAVSHGVCDAVMRQLSPYALDVDGATVGCVLAPGLLNTARHASQILWKFQKRPKIHVFWAKIHMLLEVEQ